MSTPPTPPTSSHNTSLPDQPRDRLLGKFSLPPHADIILRSSDSKDLQVQKSYLIDASPVLGERIMAASRHGTGAEVTSAAPCEATTIFPVVQLPESYTTLSALLTFVFPVPSALPQTIEEILELLSVAQKYEMVTTLTRIRDCASRRDLPFICAETALRVYSLARNYNLLEETLLAAKETLKAPMTIDTYEDKLDFISIPALYELWDYRVQVLGNLSSGFDKDFSKSEVFKSLTKLSCVEIGESSKVPLWLDNYLRSVLKDPARLDIITFYSALSSHVSSTGGGTSSGGCKQCLSISSKTVREFWTALRNFVHESIGNADSAFIRTQEPEETRAQTPIDVTMRDFPLPEGLVNLQGADVILQSSDLVSFRVHKLMLALSSPVFNKVFSLPRPCDGEVVDGLPVVHVSIDAELLQGLLTVLYPITSAIPDSYEGALRLLASLQKYGMVKAISSVRPEVHRQLPTTVDAFHAYTIASCNKLIPEMETAARLTLDHPMTFEVIEDTLSCFEGSALSDLVRFRKRCRDKLLSFFQAFVAGTDSLSKSWCGCVKTKRPHSSLKKDNGILAGWLSDLILRHIKSLQETYTPPLPNQSSFRQEFIAALRAHISETNCSSCSTSYAADEALREQLLRHMLRARDRPFRLDAPASNPTIDSGITNA